MTTQEMFRSLIQDFITDPAVSTGKMFGTQALKINGKVFAMLVKEKLVVKLPKDRVGTLIANQVGEQFDPGHGRLMKEWVVIEASTLREWMDLMLEAREFVNSTR